MDAYSVILQIIKRIIIKEREENKKEED